MWILHRMLQPSVPGSLRPILFLSFHTMHICSSLSPQFTFASHNAYLFLSFPIIHICFSLSHTGAAPQAAPQREALRCLPVASRFQFPVSCIVCFIHDERVLALAAGEGGFLWIIPLSWSCDCSLEWNKASELLTTTKVTKSPLYRNHSS